MKANSYVNLTGRVLLLLTLLAITFIYAMFQGGFVSWFIFYSFLPFGLYSLVVSVYRMSFFTVTRTVNQTHFTSGEKLKATITVERKFRFVPLLYVIVSEEVPESLRFCNQSKKAKVILFPWFKGKLTYDYVIDAIPRGEHLFTSVTIKTGDLFGLIEKARSYELPKTFLVYPQYVDLVYRQLENRFDQGYTSSRTRLVRDTAMAVGIREYQPGDRFSWIDWKASARKNSFMTKEFEQQQSHDVVVFMDRAYGQNRPLFEQVIIFTASIVKSILRHGAQVGFVSVGKDRYVAGLKNTEQHQQQIFYHLAKVQPDQQHFSVAVESEVSKWQHGLTMIFITSDLSDSFIRTIEYLTHRQYQIVVFVVLPKLNPARETLVKIEKLKQKHIFIKAVQEGQYADAFHEVSR
ncbi:DUF58 domain-containing protein [Bacillus salitolerans]|uniref:DUF58 domain-containing protein n=1 Tax=Bacillus salitolerans TaxID=1437434 RepID=A0ABW4LTR4_9BACI